MQQVNAAGEECQPVLRTHRPVDGALVEVKDWRCSLLESPPAHSGSGWVVGPRNQDPLLLVEVEALLRHNG